MRRDSQNQGLATPWAGARCDQQRFWLWMNSYSKGTAHHIIHKKLGYGKVCAQWVPKHLPENQKTARMGVCMAQEFPH
ncbi:hypothetical protein AVEN_173235-1 [Araneus ventricosus]|uniref:Uncharacterized protein n=1 Tax=Araneus ventricosus TaxID=182803 RepID=A0A4Y2H170_ARAVE|nr:hypothetical protein AVEN_173235-1 [Araneus ventricosus]